MALTSLKRTFSHARYYYLLFVGVFVFVFLLARQLAVGGLVLVPLAVQDYGLLRCELPSTDEFPVLRVLDAVYVEDLPLFETFCASEVLAEHFSSIELRSVHRDNIDLRELYESRYQLVLAKPELFGEEDARYGVSENYLRLAYFDDYGSQLISLQGMPELTPQWMRGKRLGLLDDANSVSAYQIPVAALSNSGLSDVPEILYYRSYRHMYGALFAGEVDVIPALVSDEGPQSALSLPPGLILEETLPGPGWYLHRSQFDEPTRCPFEIALRELALASPVDFFRRQKIEKPCE